MSHLVRERKRHGVFVYSPPTKDDERKPDTVETEQTPPHQNITSGKALMTPTPTKSGSRTPLMPMNENAKFKSRNDMSPFHSPRFVDKFFSPTFAKSKGGNVPGKPFNWSHSNEKINAGKENKPRGSPLNLSGLSAHARSSTTNENRVHIRYSSPKAVVAADEGDAASPRTPPDAGVNPYYVPNITPGSTSLPRTNENLSMKPVSPGLYCWGSNEHGQVNAIDSKQYATREMSVLEPRKVTLENLVLDSTTRIACGDAFTMVSRESELTIWGYLDTQLEFDSPVKKLCAGHSQALVLLDDGSVYCVRSDPTGTTHISRELEGSVCVDIGSGTFHNVVITNKGCFAWGNNEHHQLGISSKDQFVATPTPVDGLTSKLVSVSCGGRHCAAVNVNGQVVTWGAGGAGQLGLGDTRGRVLPTVVEALRYFEVVQTSCGDLHTVYLTSCGSILVSGSGGGVIEALAEDATNRIPRDAPLPNAMSLYPFKVAMKSGGAKQVSSGFEHFAVVSTTSELQVWGQSTGLVATASTSAGDTTFGSSIISVEGANCGFSSVACGRAHTVALAHETLPLPITPEGKVDSPTLSTLKTPSETREGQLREREEYLQRTEELRKSKGLDRKAAAVSRFMGSLRQHSPKAA